MRLSIIVAAAASVLLAGCSSCCNSPCKSPCAAPCKAPAPAPARAPCALRSSIVPPMPYYPSYASDAPKLTPPPVIAVTPARGSFRLPEMGAPSYYAPAPIARPAAVAVRPVVAPASAPAAVVFAPSAPASVARPSGPAAIIAPMPAGPKTEECEDCSDGHCGVPPPR